jgi:carboxypeptidase Q
VNKLRFAFVLVSFIPVGAWAEEKVDLLTVHRIKGEAIESSQVMDHLFHLTDVNGPRLTNSPGHLAAARWAVERLQSMGLAGAHLEPWGKFGRGWSFGRFTINLIEPVQAPLIGAPLAWCGGTEGPVSGEVALAPFEEKEKDREMDLPKLEERIAAYIAKYRGQLRGKVVLLRKARELALPGKPGSNRLEDADLSATAQAFEPTPGHPVELPITHVPEDPAERRSLYRDAPFEAVADYWSRLRRARQKLHAFLKEEGAAAVLTTDDRGEGGIIFAEAAGGWQEDAPPVGPTIALAPEHYNRLARLAEKKVKTVVEVDLKVSLQDQSLDGLNVVAEISGGAKRDELVMMGAHLDSWHTGTGTTDNAVGCAVVMEAARIIKALDLKPARTIRLALWSGEEQGILGSRGYVKSHFADPANMRLLPEHDRLSAYFNIDNGAGKIRGIYLQGNDMVRPIFEAWLAPWRDLGATTISIRTTGGTDHLSFDAVGLPGFQFIQDPLDYSSRTHHSNLDVYDRAQPGDLVEASMVLASFVYQAAMREEKLPRKSLPKPYAPGEPAR